MVALEAAGGLPEDESRVLAAHLSSCEGCRGELERLREAAAALAYTVAPLVPPAELRTRLLARVRELGPPALVDESVASGASGVAAAEARGRSKDWGRAPRGLTAWQILWGTPALRYGAASAFVVILALTVGLAATWQQAAQLQAEVRRISESLRDTQREMARESQEMARMREVVEVLSAPESPVVMLAGTEAAPHSRGKLVYDRQAGRAILFVSDLPPAPTGKAYQLWYIVGSNPLPGGVFAPGAKGEAVLRDRIPEGGHDASAFAVTLEPASGVPSPTGGKYLLGAAS